MLTDLLTRLMPRFAKQKYHTTQTPHPKSPIGRSPKHSSLYKEASQALIRYKRTRRSEDRAVVIKNANKLLKNRHISSQHFLLENMLDELAELDKN